MLAAGEWVCDRVRAAAGGDAEIVAGRARRRSRSARCGASNGADDAPTILCYGHFDVQPPDPLDLWESEPFELTERDGWLYARGIADDKGQLFMLLEAARRLAAAGELPVNVRFTCDGEEETGGHAIVEYLEADERGADAAIVFDSGMIKRGCPRSTSPCAACGYFHVEVRTGARDLHPGVYGGSSLNAMHALLQGTRRCPRDGRVPEPLRAGSRRWPRRSRRAGLALPAGADELAAQGSTPTDARPPRSSTSAPGPSPPSTCTGSPAARRTCRRRCCRSMRSPTSRSGSRPARPSEEIAPDFERLVREAAPAGAEVDVDLWASARPHSSRRRRRPCSSALDAFEHTVGVRPLLVRSGGSIPIVPALTGAGSR